jgi:hypothetical protein
MVAGAEAVFVVRGFVVRGCAVRAGCAVRGCAARAVRGLCAVCVEGVGVVW